MHLPSLERLKQKATSRTSRWLVGILGVIWFFVSGTTEHRIFGWINEKYNPITFLIQEIGVAIGWATSNPALFALVLGMLYCLAVILWAQFSSDETLALEIVSVWNGDQVAYQQDIAGVLTDSKAPIELRVYAGKVWHRQWPVKGQGNRWRAKCQFGNAETPGGSSYKIVAIVPKEPLDDKISELPADVMKSEIVSVVRSTEHKPKPRLTIQSAHYGRPPNTFEDVTVNLKAHLKNNRIDEIVSSRLFEASPSALNLVIQQAISPGPMFLKVVYSFGELKDLEIVRQSGERLELPEPLYHLSYAPSPARV